jgi:hypothetical protein
MSRTNKLTLRALSLADSAVGTWIKPSEFATRLNFWPRRSAWTYFKRLWRYGLLERRSSGRGTLEYKMLPAFVGCVRNGPD